jgi:hypothetical protein
MGTNNIRQMSLENAVINARNDTRKNRITSELESDKPIQRFSIYNNQGPDFYNGSVPNKKGLLVNDLQGYPEDQDSRIIVLIDENISDELAVMSLRSIAEWITEGFRI